MEGGTRRSPYLGTGYLVGATDKGKAVLAMSRKKYRFTQERHRDQPFSATQVQVKAGSLVRRDPTRLSVTKQLELQVAQAKRIVGEIERAAKRGDSRQVAIKSDKLALVRSRILELTNEYNESQMDWLSGDSKIV